MGSEDGNIPIIRQHKNLLVINNAGTEKRIQTLVLGMIYFRPCHAAMRGKITCKDVYGSFLLLPFNDVEVSLQRGFAFFKECHVVSQKKLPGNNHR